MHQTNTLDLQKSKLYNSWDLFFSRINDTKKAHKDYFENNILPKSETIAPDILKSWQRSISCGLNPEYIAPTYVSDEELETILASNKALIDMADPVLAEFAAQFSSTLFVINLVDKNFCLLKCYGDQDLMRDSKPEIRPGLIQSEELFGTTALSISRQRNTASQLLGGEHFALSFTDNVSTSAIIYLNGEIQGYINTIEPIWRKGTRTTGTLIVLAKLIEDKYKQSVLKEEIMKRAAVTEQMLNANSDGMLLTSPDGTIRSSNRAASTLLGISQSALFRTSFFSLIDDNMKLESFFRNKETYVLSREILVKMPYGKKRFYIDVTPVITNNTVTDYLISLKDSKHLKSILHSVGGWNANATFDDIIGENPVFKQVVNLAKETAGLKINTLIEGESGTGKDLFAQAIHNASNYSSGPFVTVNCGSIPANLLESELFGYEGGAFTNSKKEGQMGKFELADGGTIFLDEINSMPLDMQVKLLRAIQEKKICRVGGNTKINLDIKIIAASNCDLKKMVEDGKFRVDLFYRLNVITLHVPSLAEHKDDILAISKRILSRMSEGEDNSITLSSTAEKALLSYDWPGNVRELENVLERATVNAKLTGSNYVHEEDIISLISPLAGLRNAYSYPDSICHDSEIRMESISTFPDVNSPANNANEKAAIQSCLQKNKYNISKTSKELGISRNTLYARIKKYQLD